MPRRRSSSLQSQPDGKKRPQQRRRKTSEGGSPRDRSALTSLAHGGARPKTTRWVPRHPDDSDSSSDTSTLGGGRYFSPPNQDQMERIRSLQAENPPRRSEPEQPFVNPFKKKRRRFQQKPRRFEQESLTELRPRNHEEPDMGIYRSNRQARSRWSGVLDSRSVLRGVPSRNRVSDEPDPWDHRDIPHKPFEESVPTDKLRNARAPHKRLEKLRKEKHEKIARNNAIIHRPLASRLSGQNETHEDVERYAALMERYFIKEVKKNMTSKRKFTQAKNEELVKQTAFNYLRHPDQFGMERAFQNVSKWFWCLRRMSDVLMNFKERNATHLKPKHDLYPEQKKQHETKVEQLRQHFENLIQPLYSLPHEEHEDVYHELRRVFPDILDFAEERTNTVGGSWMAEGFRINEAKERRESEIKAGELQRELENQRYRERRNEELIERAAQMSRGEAGEEWDRRRGRRGEGEEEEE